MATVLTRRREKTRLVPGERMLVACVAGNPNVGKSSLFNALTGAGCETANCAGVSTVASSTRPTSFWVAGVSRPRSVLFWRRSGLARSSSVSKASK